MENGMHISRNCINLRWTDAPFEPKTQTKSVSNSARSTHAPLKVPNTNVKHDGMGKPIGLTACILHVVVIF